MVLGLKEELLSNKKHQVKVRCCIGATVEDICLTIDVKYVYMIQVKPILKRKLDYVVFHMWTNNTKNMT